MKRSATVGVAVAAVTTAALIGGRFGPQNRKAAVWYGVASQAFIHTSRTGDRRVWAVLEILLCITGYRLLTSCPGRTGVVALTCWFTDLAGLAGFPATFFGSKRLGATVATALFASATATAATSAGVDPIAGVAATPLVLWTAFATFLSEELWRRN
jgi:benzodiazapine receptor